MPRQADREPSRGYLRSPGLAVGGYFALGIAVAHLEPGIKAIPVLLAGAALCMLAGLGALATGSAKLPLILVLSGFVAAGAAAARLFEGRFPPNHIKNLAELGADTASPLVSGGGSYRHPFGHPTAFSSTLRRRPLRFEGRCGPSRAESGCDRGHPNIPKSRVLLSPSIFSMAMTFVL